MARAVDANVLAVANGLTEQADLDCVEACLVVLESVRNGGDLLLDAGREILSEYSRQPAIPGKPSPGAEFFRWVQQNRHALEEVELQPDSSRRYVEFPEDPRLENFDWDDRVYVALAVATGARIVNAVDSDYRNAGVPLGECGVVVDELCVDVLRPRD